MNETTQLTTQPKAQIAMGHRGMQLTTMDEAWRFATAVARSGLAPKQFDAPEKILIAIQSGAEIGLSPMQSLQCIAVINGRPSLYGDALPALAWGSGKLLEFEEGIEGDILKSDAAYAWCRTRRVGQETARETRFTVADAKRAKLWDKPGPWKEYTARMLQMRARSWNFRDNLSDVLKGIGVQEEVLDVPYNAPAIEQRPVMDLDAIPDDEPAEVQHEETVAEEAARREQAEAELAAQEH